MENNYPIFSFRIYKDLFRLINIEKFKIELKQVKRGLFNAEHYYVYVDNPTLKSKFITICRKLFGNKNINEWKEIINQTDVVIFEKFE